MSVIYDMQLAPTSAWFSERRTIQGGTYVFDYRWNTRIGLWIWDVSDAAGNPIVLGTPMLVNRNILVQYPTLTLPVGSFSVLDMTGNNQEAGLSSFNVSHKFFFVDTTQP
jgi:hypothetical protein